MSNTNIVQDFIAAVCRNQKDEILAFFSDDARYHNIPLEPRIGKAEIWQELEIIQGQASDIEWPLHNIAEAANGNVLTERTDRFKVNDKWVEIPVMGVFEIVDGKITGWRDYFDLQMVSSQFAG